MSTIYRRTPVFTHQSKSRKDNMVESYKAVLDYERINKVTTGEGAKVAVIDDGIDRDHKLLIGKVKHVFDFTDESGFKVGYHATHVGGIMAAQDHGIFPNITLGCFKVLTSSEGLGLSQWIVRGVRGARIKGYEVINASLGGDINDPEVEKEFIQFTKNDKCFIVCASGNDGKETDYPAALSSYVPGIISTGAAHVRASEIEIWIHSSVGNVTVIAPGVEILSTLPKDNTGYLSGTSMAAAFISAMIAACKAIYPEFNHHIFNFVAERCTKKLGDKKVSGYGFIQMAEFVEMVRDISEGKILVPEKPKKLLVISQVPLKSKIKSWLGL